MTPVQPSPRRVVLDANVIVSPAISSAGAPGRMVELIDATEAAKAISELRRLGECNSGPVDPPQASRDPKDDYIADLVNGSR